MIHSANANYDLKKKRIVKKADFLVSVFNWIIIKHHKNDNDDDDDDDDDDKSVYGKNPKLPSHALFQLSFIGSVYH